MQSINRQSKDNSLGPQQKSLMKGRKKIYYQKNNNENQVFMENKSPKSTISNDIKSIQDVYNPIPKRKIANANLTHLQKRTFTENDDKIQLNNPKSTPHKSPNNFVVSNDLHNKILNQIQNNDSTSDNRLNLPILNNSQMENDVYRYAKNRSTLSPHNAYKAQPGIGQNKARVVIVGKGNKSRSISNVNESIQAPHPYFQGGGNKSRSISNVNESIQAPHPYFQSRNQSVYAVQTNINVDKNIIINNKNVIINNKNLIINNKNKNYDVTINKIRGQIKEYQQEKERMEEKESNSYIYLPPSQASLHSDKERLQLKKLQIDSDEDDSLSIMKVQREVKKATHPKIQWDMSEEEWNSFGDRFPKAYEKKKLLGRGGFALVWLGENKLTKEQIAVKQILTNNTHQTHIKEIWFGSYFFDKGKPKEKYNKYRGINNLSNMVGYDIQHLDTYIFYELCGESLGSTLYELKGEGNIGNERVYRIKYKPIYHYMRKDHSLLKTLIFELAHSLLILSDCNIVHSDLKTENILIKLKKTQAGWQIAQTKLIDYGSTFTFGNLKHFSMATPEYMAPEILNFIQYSNNQSYIPKMLQFLKNYSKPYVIDIWSLGCVLLEIISGLPLWMSLKTIVVHNKQELIKTGLFAAKGRVFEAIIEKQIEVVKNIDRYLDEENFSGIIIQNYLRSLLKRMLCFDPDKRISPREICQILGAQEQLNIPLTEISPPKKDKKDIQQNQIID